MAQRRDGTCIFESERMLLVASDMKDSYIEKGYGCPNSVLDGGSAGPTTGTRIWDIKQNRKLEDILFANKKCALR